MAANRSATKAKATLRRLASEDGYSSANSQASPKGKKEKNLPLRLGLWPLQRKSTRLGCTSWLAEPRSSPATTWWRRRGSSCRISWRSRRR